jgi:DNA invertase Pin-like site-specific DNA recombinase
MRINYIAEALRTVRARGLSLGQGRVRKPVGPRRVAYKWFEEQASSVGARPVLEQALGFVREGDVFVVTKIDRLPRSIVNLCEIVARVEKRKASLRALAMNLDTGTTTGKLILNVVGSIAEFEREMMLERQREGIAKAKGEGKYKGRAPTARPRR